MTEFHLIKKYFKPLTKKNSAARNLSDDVAKISLKKDEELVISKDMFVENVHFLQDDGAFKIASKLLRTNLSDLAASGANPLYYLLGFSKNKNSNQKFLQDFSRGLKSAQDEFGLCLIGGDTVSSKESFFSVTIFGKVKKGEILSRDGAKAGDLIFVSGTIGDAFLGLKEKLSPSKKLTKTEKKYLLDRHFFPTPRIKLGQELLEKKLSKCAIDVSDGLLADLRHICQSSKLDAEIDLEKIPFSLAAKKIISIEPQTKLDLLSGGDDYELIFATNPKNQKKISALSKALKLDLTCIGSFKPSTKKIFEITLSDKNNRKIKIKKFGYEHF